MALNMDHVTLHIEDVYGPRKSVNQDQYSGKGQRGRGAVSGPLPPCLILGYSQKSLFSTFAPGVPLPFKSMEKGFKSLLTLTNSWGRPKFGFL